MSDTSYPFILYRTTRVAPTGHSMGGHGALTLYLREEGLFKSCSAFAPIAHPTAAPWGKKAISGYLNDASRGAEHDATELISKLSAEKRKLEFLIDSGLADNFYSDKQLLPEDFEAAARKAGYEEKHVQVRLQDGYDHSCELTSTRGEVNTTQI